MAQPHLRTATEEEIEKLKATSNITPNSQVLAWDSEHGTDFAVIRACFELDPVKFAESSITNRRAAFIWALEERMLASGIPEYYFNVRVDDPEKWHEAVKKWGAEPTSLAPEIRYKKVLIK